MSGRKARQWREARTRLRALPSCDCGARERPGPIVCHGPTCVRLRALGPQLRQRGFCTLCGYRLIRRIGWDGSFGTIVRMARCPRGCMNDMSWVRPDDVTDAELARLGLRRVPVPDSSSSRDDQP